MHTILCIRSDICFLVVMINRYQPNLVPLHWIVDKHILKYLRLTIDYILVYNSEDLIPTVYTNFNFHSDRDSQGSTLKLVFTLGGGAINWRSVKQSHIVDSTIGYEYVAACEVAKEDVCLIKSLMDIGVMSKE